MIKPKRRRALPPIPRDANPALRQYLQAMQEIAETGEGVRGNSLDRKLTIRDLIDSGLAKLKGRFNGYIDGSMLEGSLDLDATVSMSTPPRPEEVYVVAVFNAVIISWKLPHLQYGNHAFAEVWRSEGEQSRFDDAVNIGSGAGSTYSDYTVVGGEKYRYWVRYVSTADVSGPLDSPQGSVVEAIKSAELIMEEISGRIDESHLTEAFSGRIEGIQETVSEHGDLYTLTVNNDGYVSGFGTYNDGETSDFAILADRFWVTAPNSVGKIKPFIIDNGVTYIQSAMIAEGSIESGQIGSLSFGKVTDAEGIPVINVAGKLKGDLIEAENLVVAEAAKFSGDVYSVGVPYIPNVQGWIIKQDGFVEFNNAQIRGNVDLDSLTVNGELPEAGVVIDSTPYSKTHTLTNTEATSTITFDDSETLKNVPAGATFQYDKLANLSFEVYGATDAEVRRSSEMTTWKVAGGSIVQGSDKLPFDGTSKNYISDSTELISDLGGTKTYRRTGYYYNLKNGLSTTITANCRIYFKVWVDDVLQINESKSKDVDFTLTPIWTGNTSNYGEIIQESKTEKLTLSIPLSPGTKFTYSAFRASTKIRVFAQLHFTNARASRIETPASSRQISVRRDAAGISGNLSRL